jgi:two-component system response regulator DesR
MIRTALAVDGGLARGALAYVLSAHDDIEVVAEVGDADEAATVILERRPDVTVFDLDLIAAVELPRLCEMHRSVGRCRALVLVPPRRARQVAAAMTRHASDIAFLGNSAPPHSMVDAIRRLSRGERVVDADLVVAALDEPGPLTPRERDVLDLAAQGLPVREIAASLGISAGTVRNHLARVTMKAGARTRIEAIRTAQDAGWI